MALAFHFVVRSAALLQLGLPLEVGEGALGQSRTECSTYGGSAIYCILLPYPNSLQIILTCGILWNDFGANKLQFATWD